MRLLIFLSIISIIQCSIQAQTPAGKVNNATIHVDGQFKNQQTTPSDTPAITDEEIQFLNSELKNVRNLKKGYQKKQRLYGKLVKESDGLKENFESYIEQKGEWEEAIGGYNKLLECTQSKKVAECMSGKKKKRVEREVAPTARPKRRVRRRRPVENQDDFNDWDELSSIQASPMRLAPAVKNQTPYAHKVDKVIAGQAYQLNRCYTRARTHQEGRLPVLLKIGPSGQLDHLGWIDTTQIYAPKLLSCLSNVLYSIQYPMPPQREITSVKKLFLFELRNRRFF
jgi:hypothetical protein